MIPELRYYYHTTWVSGNALMATDASGKSCLTSEAVRPAEVIADNNLGADVCLLALY
jgi:hypothetical protein